MSKFEAPAVGEVVLKYLTAKQVREVQGHEDPYDIAFTAVAFAMGKEVGEVADMPYIAVEAIFNEVTKQNHLGEEAAKAAEGNSPASAGSSSA